MAANADGANRKMPKWAGKNYSQGNGWTLADLVRSAEITSSGEKRPIDSHIIFPSENNSNGCKLKWQESWEQYKVQQKAKRLFNSPYTHFSPAPMGLEELCEVLNSIKVFNKTFNLREQRLRMICKGINEVEVEEFISLLQKCSIHAEKGNTRGGSSWVVIVRGVGDATHFLNSRVELVDFAKKYNASAIRCSA